MAPKVTVIIPTYNRSVLLKTALNSVINQTFENFEVLIIDDCSTDDTEEVMNDFNDPRIKYLKNATNKGIASARNKGINNAFGEYIAFLDDDDEWVSTHKLERQISGFENCPKETGLMYSGVRVVDRADGKTIKKVVPKYRGFILSEFILDRFLTTSTLLIRKECFDRAGLFDESIPYGEDFDMWIRILKEYKADYINEQFVVRNYHDNNITKNIDSVIDGLEIILKKNAALFSSNKKAYARMLFELGVRYCYKKEISKGSKIIKKAIQLYPYDPRFYYNYMISFLGADTYILLKELRDRYASKGVK